MNLDNKKLFKENYNKLISNNKKISNIFSKGDKLQKKTITLSQDYLHSLYKKELKDEYNLEFDFTSVYFYKKHDIKENYILKITFLRDENSSTPLNFTNSYIKLNQTIYKDLSLLLKITNLIQIYNSYYTNILNKVNANLNNYIEESKKLIQEINVFKQDNTNLQQQQDLLIKNIFLNILNVGEKIDLCANHNPIPVIKVDIGKVSINNVSHIQFINNNITLFSFDLDSNSNPLEYNFKINSLEELEGFVLDFIIPFLPPSVIYNFCLD